MKLIKDLGMLYATPTSKRKTRFGLYECPKCEKPHKTTIGSVKKGDATQCKSCSYVTHGETKTRLHNTWLKMKQRCYNKKDKSYKNYGGRGIILCDEWLSSYETFRDWALVNGYNEILTIDRRENDGNYEPLNCRWTTKNIQARNTRKIMSSNTSGYRGASWDKKGKKWRAYITINSKQKVLGYFDYPYTAAYAYDSYIIKHNLEHTRNFKGI